MPSWRSDSAIKLITYSEELVDGKPFYAFSNSCPVKALNLEPAGHAFHSAALKLLGCAEKPRRYAKGSDKKVGDDDDKDEEYVNPSFNPFANKSKKKKKMRPACTQQQQEDHYALLGLKSLRYLATEDQIKKGYREAALKHHPDKLINLILAEETEEAKEAKKDEIESRFRAIQEAYEVLLDPTKRKIFDSTDEFNDVEEDLSPREFFKVFGSAFKRTARWSAAGKRVPDLGDENTNPKDVDKFYSFWYGFKSLRKFTDEERHDPEKASSRQERRWMERENAKNKEKVKKEENVRIQTLVENAYRMDPRIAKRKEDKQRKKEAKRMAEEKREEEAAEKEKRRKEEAAKYAEQQKKAKEKERNLLRKERNRLRTLSAHVLAQRLVSKEDVENLCMSLNFEQLQNLNETMGSKQGVELANVIKEHEANSSKEKESEKAEPTKLDNTQEKKENEKAEPTKLDNTEKKKQEQWSKEEIDKLKKGIVKYPKGTSRRWEVISDYIGTGRSVEEILKATKSVILQKPDSAKAFDSFLEKRKPTGPIASPLSTREELGESLPMANNGEASGSSDTDGWSSVEERALVQALKTFPKETSQRWERVAAAIPGKTVVQCKKKFTELKEFIRSKKSGVV